MKVHILATCRDFEIVKGTTLVFDSLRVGFPDAEIVVTINESSDERGKSEVEKACLKVGAEIRSMNTIHHEWIESLVRSETEPFVVLDTDIIFWERCDQWKFENPLAGRLIPRFYDGFTKCVTMPRLHGSFLWIDPVELTRQIEQYKSQFPKTPFNPIANLFHPICIPQSVNGETVTLFHDTCCLLYQAIGGQSFTDAQLECYDHLNCGTISDIVAPHLPKLRLRESHFAVFENRLLAKGQWRNQNAYYAAHRA